MVQPLGAATSGIRKSLVPESPRRTLGLAVHAHDPVTTANDTGGLDPERAAWWRGWGSYEV